MKNLILALGAVLAVSASASEWTTYSGCYETLSFDGQPVENPRQAASWVTDGPASIFLDGTTQKEIPATNFFVYVQATDEWDEFQYMPIFLDRGERHSLPDGASATFTGPLSWADDEGVLHPVAVEMSTRVTDLNEQSIKIDYTMKTTTTDEVFEKTSSAILGKIDCADAVRTRNPKIRRPF
jgi:hypothetical protein